MSRLFRNVLIGVAVLSTANGWSVDVPAGLAVTVDPEGWTLARYRMESDRFTVPG